MNNVFFLLIQATLKVYRGGAWRLIYLVGFQAGIWGRGRRICMGEGCMVNNGGKYLERGGGIRGIIYKCNLAMTYA